MTDITVTIAPSVQFNCSVSIPASAQFDCVVTVGAVGPGVAAGGATGEILRKASGADYDTEWHGLVKADVGLANVDNTSDIDKPVSTAQQTALDAKVAGNTAIIGATKTKITYDAKGLVTGGADATTADITDSVNARYVTDAQLSVLGNTSGTNTGDQDLSGYAQLASANFTALQVGAKNVAAYEQGSNANGEWFKWLDAAGNVIRMTQTWSNVTSATVNTTVTLPTAFPDANYIPSIGSLNGVSSDSIAIPINITNESSFLVAGYRVAANVRVSATHKGTAEWVKV